MDYLENSQRKIYNATCFSEEVNIVFTRHAKEQMKERGISEDEVINTIKFPEQIRKVSGAYYVQKQTISGKIEVVYVRENYIKSDYRISTMKVTYDPDADAMYVKFTNEKFSKTKVIDDNTILDLDKNGNVIGIELLFVSKHLPKDFFSRVVVETLQ